VAIVCDRLNKNRKVDFSLYKRYLGDIEKDFFSQQYKPPYHLHVDSLLYNASGENVLTASM
jgi:hypothetical protein